MFRKKVRSIAELLPEFLRNEGLETPLQQKRLLDSWDTVVGASISVYCADKFIKKNYAVANKRMKTRNKLNAQRDRVQRRRLTGR